MSPTNYVEDYDGERNDDAVEPVTLSPVFDHSNDTKRLEVESVVEDKAVKTSAPAKKSAAKKKA